MYCKYCGSSIADDSIFCSVCGKKILDTTGEITYNVESDINSAENLLPKLIEDFELVFVGGGAFTMGATTEQGAFGLFSDRKPAHEVRLDSFLIGRFPVSQSWWEAVMNYNNSRNKGTNLPVTNINRIEALEFLNSLTEATGFIFRLPTEAEWEYAARGGQFSKGYKYPGSNNVDEVAWYKSNSGKQIHPVGQLKPNELGIYDMAGNVFEFCSDVYESGYYKKSPLYNPQGPAVKGMMASLLTSASEFVLRGCSYYFGADYAASSFRYYAEAGTSDDNLGFRYVVELPK